MLRRVGVALVAGAALLCAPAVGAQAVGAVGAQTGEPIRLGLIEGFSGPFANAGDAVWRNILLAVERVNGRGGVRIGGLARSLTLEQLDGKGQADGALNRHNERCSFWHFRFDAHVGMRMSALTAAMAQNSRIRRVYLLNQDYSFGQQVAKMAREMIAARRPDIEIVGDELHPLGRIKDFVPYAAKIRAAGADTVVTGNWGNDLTLLVRATREIGLAADFYTFYGNGLGAPAAIGDDGVGRVRAVAEWHPNAGLASAEPTYADFRSRLRSPRDDYFNMRHVVMIEMLVAAIEAAGSTEAAAVARALEGRTHDAAPYEATMRGDDHQLLTPLHVSVMRRAGSAAERGAPVFDLEGSGFGFVTERRVDAQDSAMPHACRMQRPS